MSAATKVWRAIIRGGQRLIQPLREGLSFVKRLAPASRKERAVAVERATQILSRVAELRVAQDTASLAPELEPRAWAAQSPQPSQTPVKEPHRQSETQEGETPLQPRVRLSPGPFLNKQIEREVAAIGQAAERRANALLVEAFQSRGGVFDRRINIALLVSDLGLRQAVEVSASCVEALSRDRLRSIFPRPDDAAYEQLLRVMEARRWAVRRQNTTQ